MLGHGDYHYEHEPILYGYTPAPSRRGRGAGSTLVGSIFAQPSVEAVWAQFHRVVDQLTERFAEAAVMLEGRTRLRDYLE